MYFHFVKKSGNTKTGPIPTTTSPRKTCPDNCALKDTGCYAEAGFYTKLNWNHVDNGTRGDGWDTFLDKVSDIPPGDLWRHNIAGDLRADADRPANIDADALTELAVSNGASKGFTYTHYALNGHNVNILQWVNRNTRFTVNVSCDTWEQVQHAVSRDLPAVCVLPAETTAKSVKRDDITVVTCPATIRDDVTCKDCALCTDKNRQFVIGFPAHGSAKAKAQPITFFK